MALTEDRSTRTWNAGALPRLVAPNTAATARKTVNGGNGRYVGQQNVAREPPAALLKGAHGSPGFIGSAHIYQIRKISRFKADPLVSVERESSLCDRYDMQNIMRSSEMRYLRSSYSR
ncbi:hypothetical protein EVAR_99253_1 [Eumeta japonica]|uniref:Uncharacterized protein n=1 Tax=Eumeta variegata TaxID=151549 RepID=A0A4C2A233_EUMVA|nr:hypothetical protein EVAR_99253_1 [Eumeta japonica]